MQINTNTLANTFRALPPAISPGQRLEFGIANRTEELNKIFHRTAPLGTYTESAYRVLNFVAVQYIIGGKVCLEWEIIT